MPKTIFILEDNLDLRELYELILKDENYEIKSFGTVTEFMESAHEVPDLYLLDVMLPDGDGLQVCSELKKNLPTAHVPVIMVSAHKRGSEVKLRCPEADFIAKPFDIDDLIRQIAAKINRGSR